MLEAEGAVSGGRVMISVVETALTPGTRIDSGGQSQSLTRSWKLTAVAQEEGPMLRPGWGPEWGAALDRL